MTRPAKPDVATPPFVLESLVNVSAPDGGTGEWHRYVISQGPNQIVGVREGTAEEVGSRVEDMVQALNERRLGRYQSKARMGARRRETPPAEEPQRPAAGPVATGPVKE